MLRAVDRRRATTVYEVQSRWVDGRMHGCMDVCMERMAWRLSPIAAHHGAATPCPPISADHDCRDVLYQIVHTYIRTFVRFWSVWVTVMNGNGQGLGGRRTVNHGWQHPSFHWAMDQLEPNPKPRVRAISSIITDIQRVDEKREHAFGVD